MQNVTLVTMVAEVVRVRCVLETQSSHPEVTPLTVTQRRRVMVFQRRRMLNTPPVVPEFY